MKRTAFLSMCAISLLGAVLTVIAGPQRPEWKKVEAAMEKGLPKTAIQELEPLIKSALSEKDYDQAAKAILTKIALEGQIQGNKPEERITRLEAAMTNLPAAMQPAMEVVLAHWYWQYFQQNRWRFMQRTQQANPTGDDITTWDLPRILTEIDQHFSAALKSEKWLKSTPIADFDELLNQGSLDDSYRPTLYDFVAHEALKFYGAGEQAGAKSQDAYVLSSDSPIFAPVPDFLDWQINATDQGSPLVKAIRLYQSLLAFHQPDDDPTALADADLSRLEFGFQHAFGETKKDRYKSALERFIERWKDHRISARAIHSLAQVWYDQGEFVTAHNLATNGKQAFPDTPGGHACHNLIQQIEAKSMNISIERVWNNPWPSIQLQYRNLETVHFRAIRYDWQQLVTTTNYQPNRITDQLRRELLAQKPDFQWSQDLPATDDYQANDQELPVPREVKSGFHFLIASPDEQFREEENQIFCAEFWVSPLAIVLRSGTSSSVQGFILDADTGLPLSDAQIRAWHRTNNRWVEGRPARSNQDGMFSVAASERQNCLLLAKHSGHELGTANSYRARRLSRDPKPFERTVLFTDRAIYRPGQTIRYKGICVAIDQNKDNYRTLASQSVTIVFTDANRQEIARATHRTNKLGSFDGSFTAPSDRLTGQMRLSDPQRGGSQASISVEEYKRPKFRVELDAPESPARLDTKVQVPGTAKAYTGAAIGQAQVAYRVVREVQFPIWHRWLSWGPPSSGNSQEIAHGTTTTDDQGHFAINFTARPDPATSKKEEPTFRFTIYADVTDTTGETRSDQHTINVGFKSLQASMTAADWQTVEQAVELTIHTNTLDGQPQAAKGSVKIYHLDPPATVQRPDILNGRRPGRSFQASSNGEEQQPDLSDPNTWPLADVAAELDFATDASGLATKTVQLDVGAYRAVLETQDDAGQPVTAILPIQVLDPQVNRLTIKVPHLMAAPEWSVEPGETFLGLWGTGYESGRAYIEIEHRGKMIQSYWSAADDTQVAIEQGINETMRGGFTLHVTYVRENRAYLESRRVDVPWTNKQLAIRWEHFVSKLKPGQQETWTAIINGPKDQPVTAEIVATLYDASLDAYRSLNWPNLQLFRQDRSWRNSQFENQAVSLRHLAGNWSQDFLPVDISYRSFPPEIVGFFAGGGLGGGVMRGQRTLMFSKGRAVPSVAFSANSDGLEAMPEAAAPAAAMGEAVQMEGNFADRAKGVPPNQPSVDLANVSARKNLNETAFFFPQLLTDENGQVQLQFTMPEALTEWKFMGFAHDAALRSGSLTDTAVTSKDLMVQPLPPRFVREGDQLEFTVKVTNQSPTRQTGTVRLTFNQARTLESVDQQLGNANADRSFDVAAGQSKTYSWRLTVPDGIGFLTYKAVGSTGRLSDGEEGYLPVLSRRVLVTESLPLPIRDAGSTEFEFKKLLDSSDSDSLRHQSLTVQMASNPAWYAVMALPYLMEFPYECTEQTFNRLYANVLARHIANADPKIRRVFDQWKATPALDSPLEKNQDIKAVMLEETPWVRQAQKESQARRDVGILFDDNRLNDETSRLLRKLSDQQQDDGAWPWFPGGRGNDYITLYITTGFGRLRHLGADIDVASAVKSLSRLDGWIDQTYRRILKNGDPEKNHLTPSIALYLYGRSFFLDDLAIDAKHRSAVDYFLEQGRQFWLQLGNRQSQAHLALALHRFGDNQVPQQIMRSIKEYSVTEEELGMFWRDTERSWWWYRAPIETQAMMIEAFDEVMNDTKAVADCRVWLLKQKQTQDWKTTKATADAVYSLLLRGADLLASDALVQVKLADRVVEPEDVEAGTGFYEKKFGPAEIQPDMGHIQVTKTDPGVAWGSVHWQYLEDMSQVTPYEGTPLTLRKDVFIKVNTKQGPQLRNVDGPISVGDELVTRIQLRVDRDMEYVHLKDQRGSGLEPVDVLSHYQYQDGLAYYQSTRDTASHFFIDYLPKGTYVFEYSTRVVHRGKYQTGMAEIQCMYAPEFNSHSASSMLTVE